MKRAAALVLPRAENRGDGERGVHVHSAIAVAGEAIAKAEISALPLAKKPCHRLDLRRRNAADAFRPFRRAAREVRLEVGAEIGEFREIITIREIVAQQDVQDAASKRAIRAGLHEQRDIGLLHRVVHVDIDRYDLCAARFPGADGVIHHVDLRVHGVRAPDDHAIRFVDLARVDAREPSRAGDIPGPGRVGADGVVHTGIALHMAQAMDAVAHHQAHCAGVVIGPDAFRPVLRLGGEKRFRRAVERFVPRDFAELARSFRAGAHERLGQAIPVVDALGIARDFRAYDAGGIGLGCEPPHPTDAVVRENLDIERTGARAIVRANRGPEDGGDGRVHGVLLKISGAGEEACHRKH